MTEETEELKIRKDEREATGKKAARPHRMTDVARPRQETKQGMATAKEVMMLEDGLCGENKKTGPRTAWS